MTNTPEGNSTSAVPLTLVFCLILSWTEGPWTFLILRSGKVIVLSASSLYPDTWMNASFQSTTFRSGLRKSIGNGLSRSAQEALYRSCSPAAFFSPASAAFVAMSCNILVKGSA